MLPEGKSFFADFASVNVAGLSCSTSLSVSQGAMCGVNPKPFWALQSQVTHSPLLTFTGTGTGPDDAIAAADRLYIYLATINPLRHKPIHLIP